MPARSAMSRREKPEARIGRQARQPRLLEGDVVVVVELSTPMTSSPRASKALADMHADKPGGAGDQDFHGRLLLKSQHFRILGEAGRAADEDVHQARHAVEQAQAQEIELGEAQQRRHQQRGARRGALALRQRRFGSQRAVAVLLRQIGFQRLRRLVQQVARPGSRLHPGDHPLMHRIVDQRARRRSNRRRLQSG
jgi:hypothetical protein